MTRKDYEAIAAAINGEQRVSAFADQINTAHTNALAAVSRRIADVMARDNPRFDRARFLKACGVQS